METIGRSTFLAAILVLGGLAALAAPEAKKRGRMVFARLELADATVPECVERVRVAAAEWDPEGLGINVVLKLSPEGARKRIALKLENFGTEDAWRRICALADLQWCLVSDVFVIGEELPNHAAFDKEMAKHRGTAAFASLRAIHLDSTEPIGGMSLLKAVEWLTVVSHGYDPAGEGLHFALMDAKRCGSVAAAPLNLVNLPLLESVRYFAYVNDFRVELRDGQVLLHSAEPERKEQPNEQEHERLAAP